MGPSEGLPAAADEVNFLGATIEEDVTAQGSVIALSNKSRRDCDRWETMPSLACFPALQSIDLNKCRYIESIHESLTELKQLRSLRLTGCSRLKSIPASIGQLLQLEEVR
jgi:hypothetical protein